MPCKSMKVTYTCNTNYAVKSLIITLGQGFPTEANYSIKYFFLQEPTQ